MAEKPVLSCWGFESPLKENVMADIASREYETAVRMFAAMRTDPEAAEAKLDQYRAVRDEAYKQFWAAVDTLAAGEGKKAPPEPQSRSQERRFKVQGEREGE